MVASASEAAAEVLAAYIAKVGMPPIGADPERPEAEIVRLADTLDGAAPVTDWTQRSL
jgi:hypothetical protein